MDLNGVIPPYGYSLIANGDGYDTPKPPDNTYDSAVLGIPGTAGTVFLVNSQVPLTSPMNPSVKDKLGFGTGSIYPEGGPAPIPSQNGSLERKAFPDSNTSSMTTVIDSGMGNGFDSLEEIAKIKMAYWDDSASSYVPIPTTISYDPASGTTWDNFGKC